MKMYQYNFFNELIIDNFAGGGASVGIELAVGRRELCYKKVLITVADLEKAIARSAV
jgi:hypothetical protein